MLPDSNWGESKNWIWNNQAVHYRVEGEKEKKPIVLIHGFGASSDHWRFNAKPLALNGFRVYGIDLIGFGKSDQKTHKKNIYLDNFFWAKQIEAFLEEIVNVEKNGKAILIGNSLGGLTAITTKAIRPEFIQAVIAAPLPDTAFMAPFKLKREPILIKSIKKLFLRIFFNLLPLKLFINLIIRTKIINFALQSAYNKPISNDNNLKEIIIKPAIKPYAAKALRSMCIGMSIRDSSITAPELLKRIQNMKEKTPVLIIWGRQDKLVPLSLARKIIRMHPWINLQIFENSGHCPHDELPNYFNQSILKWLEINLKSL